MNRANPVGVFLARGLGLLALGILAAAERGLAQEERPLVAISFAVESPEFKATLDAALPDLERAVAERLRALCQERFGFLAWTEGSRVADRSQLAALFQVSLIEKQGGFGPHILIGYAIEIGGQRLAGPDLLPVEIYGPVDNHPTHEPDKLRAKVVEALEGEFGNQDYRRRFLDQFLRRIPLLRKMEARDDKQLLLPIRRLKLQARNGSELLAEFHAQMPQEGRKNGRLLLRQAGEVLDDGPQRGLTLCSVLEFDYAPVTGHRGWHDRIPELLNHLIADTLRVYMWTYDPDFVPGTSGSLATDLN